VGVMDKLLELMAQKKASDMFISPGSPVHIKINGLTLPINQQKLDPGSVGGLIKELVNDSQWQEFQIKKELNTGYGLRGIGSFRVNAFMQRGSPSAVIRFIPGDIPSFDELNLPTVLRDVVMEKRGLVLIVGSTGSGKSTTLASMLDYRNEHKTGHILTLEDPIEFTFRNKRSIVNQRQIGTDTDTLEIALKNAMRQAPDCILIGEIRDQATMTAALAYSQSGHLVLATLHANSSNHALNRIVSFYSPDNRRVLLSDLAASLKGIICQRLIKSIEGGRLPAVEVLLNTRHVQELIEQGRLPEIKEAVEKSMAPGSQSFDQALVKLVNDKRITREDALANADSPTQLLWLMENAKLPDAKKSDLMPGLSADMAANAVDLIPGTSGSMGQNSSADGKPPAASFSEFLLNV
jgi:twitching motility protein PilU